MPTPNRPGDADADPSGRSGVDRFAETRSQPFTPGTPVSADHLVQPGGDGAASPPPAGEQYYPYGTADQYEPVGYPQADGYPPAGYPDSGYPHSGYPQSGYPQAGQYPPSGYPVSGGYPSYPPPQQGSGSGRAVLLGVAIACVLGLAVAAVVIWTKVDRSGEQDMQAQQAGVTAQQPVETVTSVITDPETDAATSLRNQAAADAADFRGVLNNRWTAQISAKRPGLYAEGRTWDNQAILAEFNSSRGRYPQVRLLDSSDWPVFSDSGWWVTVTAQSFPGPGAALSWCAANGLDADHCFAKLISSTQGPDGSTLYQR